MAYVLLILSAGVLYASYGPFFAAITEMLPRNVAGGAMALVNSMGALGSFVGTYVVGWLNGATGGPGTSFLSMSLTLLAATLLMIAVQPIKSKAPVARNGEEMGRTTCRMQAGTVDSPVDRTAEFIGTTWRRGTCPSANT